MADIIDDLGASAEELRQTHISWVFLYADHVLKLKKPVDFGFLDFSTRERRLAACESEVRLNARLAPGVYLGVVPITRDGDGVHRAGGSGEVVDHAVHMRRLSDEVRADRLLSRGQLGWPLLDALARTVARFHAAAATSETIAGFGGLEAIARNVEENFAQARDVLRRLASEPIEREVEARQLGFLRERRGDFERRVASGKVRDGHGDLRLEHVYFLPAGPGRPSTPIVIDCIEFNDRFRYADVCADIAFLSMDLGYHGRVDLKERWLAAYARESDDYDLYRVVDFYESYRAYVRAKVSALALESTSLGFSERRALEQQARRYLLLALAAERSPLTRPRLIAVGGVIASGKSTLADALGAELALPVISSDRTRKAMFGVAPTEPLDASAYTSSVSDGVYSELLRRAEGVLGSGRSVVLDATFGTRASRAALRALAQRSGSEFVLVECAASEAVLRERLRLRAEGPSVSDARLELYDDFVARYEPVVELPAGEHVRLDTSGSPKEALHHLRALGVLGEHAP